MTFISKKLAQKSADHGEIPSDQSELLYSVGVCLHVYSLWGGCLHWGKLSHAI